MEKLFKLKEHGTNVQREMVAGLTTFMAMAYILAVNPSILSATGMNGGAIFTATALASALASILMGLVANLPFALSAGMGLNAYFAFTVVLGMGASWQLALAAVFTEGIVFIILSLTNVREAIFNSIPLTLKTAVSAGIGLFIIIIALINAHLVVDNPSTLVSLISIHGTLEAGTFHSIGIQAILCLVGIIITALLMYYKVHGNMLLGIIFTWLLGIACEFAGLYVPNPAEGFYSTIPTAFVSLPQSMETTIGQCFEGFRQVQNGSISIFSFIVICFAFLFVDIFDTLGTLIGCAHSGKMLDSRGRLPGIKGALVADAVGTTLGAFLGTSTITTFVESASGIAVGGRTGLTAITTAAFFLLALFFSPLFLTIPSFATSPALIMVGFLMLKNVSNIPWDDITEAVPAFLAIIAMPFFYSISEGISFGIISYVAINIAVGNTKKINPILIACTILFVLKYIFI